MLALPINAPQAPLATSRTTEQDEIVGLRAHVDRLQRYICDCEIALVTSNEHGDLLQEQLYRLSKSLESEVRERRVAEEKLQKLLQAITREKGDLEVLVQILIEQGDIAAAESENARIDGLTQIANRRRFDEYLVREWDRHLRLHQPLSLLICDVDHFKRYNDLYGHQAGDQCLKLVATGINQCIRSGDLVARYGGEEFAMILPETHSEVAVQVAERVRLRIENVGLPHAASWVCGHVTLSIGVACRTPQSTEPLDASTLIEEADKNLYRAKKCGRNRVH